ncbi:tRNA modification GTPase MnmE [Pirellulimonas nuda]|uniref:tRNA modification GTPase MnmE n=1 Tax=Pirellulimonas nuda TaxID=2528009 RepID=A0A518DDJ6_9BACT|nr:GTPase [Pirellulimonas nuda]QDU89551.1 tRNA modification GTPase MnmE [Pirellulimonas nuda]
MNRRWIALGAVLAGVLLAPYLALLGLGFVWLNEHGWLMTWLIVAAISSLAATLLHWSLRGNRLSRPRWRVEPDPEWTDTDRQAWSQVQHIAHQAGGRALTLGRLDELQALGDELFTAVARAYFPRAREPLLQVTVPDTLAIVELAAHDLRAIAENLPGSRALSLGQVRRLQSTGSAAWAAYELGYRVYRVARSIYNPLGALVNEAGGVGTRRSMDWLRKDFQRRAQTYSVELAGKYAIELYSGRIQLRSAHVQQYVTQRSRRDSAASAAKQRGLLAEPLRVLVLGQVKAGKSSLINALFGQLRAAVDVVPCTRSVEPFVLQREGQTEAIVLDTAGYEDASAAGALLGDLVVESQQADLILLAVSASQAARAPDQLILRAIRQSFEGATTRQPPPCIVALTHIDRLRPPQAWAPPYDLTSDDPKARSIREVMAVVAEELALPLESIAPVCLFPDRLYNVTDGLMPLLVQAFSEAERSRVARVLTAHQTETQWSNLWRQAIQSGRLSLTTLGDLYRPK